MNLRILGIDLSADENTSTGIAELEENKVRTFTVRKDSEIIEIINLFKPNVVVIGSPLAISEEPFRAAEKEMQQLNYDVTNVNDPMVQKISKRASHIRYQMEKVCEFIETNLFFVKKILGIDHVNDIQTIRILNMVKNEKENNAVLCAATGLFYMDNNYNEFGEEETGKVILPKI